MGNEAHLQHLRRMFEERDIQCAAPKVKHLGTKARTRQQGPCAAVWVYQATFHASGWVGGWQTRPDASKSGR